MPMSLLLFWMVSSRPQARVQVASAVACCLQAQVSSTALPRSIAHDWGAYAERDPTNRPASTFSDVNANAIESASQSSPRRHLAVLHRSARSFSLLPDRVKRRVLAQSITLHGEDPVVPPPQPQRAHSSIVSCALWPVLPLVTPQRRAPLALLSSAPARPAPSGFQCGIQSHPARSLLQRGAGLSGRDITEDQIACERVKNPLLRELLSPLPAPGITPHAQPSEAKRASTPRSKALLILPIAVHLVRTHRWLAAPHLIATRASFSTPSMSSLAMAPNSSSEDDSRLLAASMVGPARPTPAKKQNTATKQKKPGKTRALSTERSRQCRERQKLYSENLEAVVRALRTEVCDLEILRNLRREQSLQVRGSVSGSLAKIVREYMTVFRHGVPAPTVEAATTGKNARSRRSTSRHLTPSASSSTA